MIKLSKLTKTYGDKVVLDSITETFSSRQTHVILGSSGCGKSTLIRLMVGLIPADSGSIFIDDLEVTPSIQTHIAKISGYVLQNGGLFPHLNVRQNVCLPGKLENWSDERLNGRLLELCDLVRIDKDLLDKYPKQLSGGQKQRLGLMRGLFLDPQLMFLDEPLGALDPITRSELQEDLKRIFNTLKKTVVMVTHDIGEAAFFGHTVSLMKDGKVLQSGTFSSLIHEPKDPYVTKFINAQRSVVMERAP